ncbi:response regulator transcription factor [Streptomyces sp. NPDC005648]|uniref:response regulator transcription factor n=1 Tax=Streptomyces sp. NPDC005648 TaxID=3157044 RepID=UPI0033AC2E03
MNNESRVPDHPRVLVSREVTSTAETLVMALGIIGFDAHFVATGAEMIHQTRRRGPDTMLLDTTLPDLGGVEVCRQLRREGIDTPVVFLSSRTAVEDKCHALAMGGDDYVTIPFDLTELNARLRALVRRCRRGARATEISDRRLGAAGVELDEDTREVRLRGTAVQLSTTEFALLRLLLRNAGRVVPKGKILDTVWNYGFQGESGVMETYIYTLRRKLDDAGRSLIRTVRGAGYMLYAG